LSNSSEGVIHVVKRPSHDFALLCDTTAETVTILSIHKASPMCTAQHSNTMHKAELIMHHASQLSAKGKPTQTADQEGWSVVQADQPKAYNKIKMIEKTIQNCTTLTTSRLDQELCSICCNPLGSGQVLSLSKCGMT
jgi:hypothetical protein